MTEGDRDCRSNYKSNHKQSYDFFQSRDRDTRALMRNALGLESFLIIKENGVYCYHQRDISLQSEDRKGALGEYRRTNLSTRALEWISWQNEAPGVLPS